MRFERAIDAASQSSNSTHALTHQHNSLFDSHGDAMTIAFRLLVKIKSTGCMIAPTKFNDLNFCFDAIYRNYGEHAMTSHVKSQKWFTWHRMYNRIHGN